MAKSQVKSDASLPLWRQIVIDIFASGGGNSIDEGRFR